MLDIKFKGNTRYYLKNKIINALEETSFPVLIRILFIETVDLFKKQKNTDLEIFKIFF